MYYVAEPIGSQPLEAAAVRRFRGERAVGQAGRMGGKRIPIIILAGSDRFPAVLPESGRDKHPLSGYKGADVQIGGRSLIAALAERIAESEAFDPLYVVGPSRAYECLPRSTRLIDSDGTIGQNARKGIEAVRAAHGKTPVAFVTCDILPEADGLRRLLESYRAAAPCDLWFPMVQAPTESGRLGASAWKPAYRIVSEPGTPATRVLPGHLAIADPEALRLRFLYRLIDAGYRTRNRPIHLRRAVMVRGVVAALLFQDLLHLFAGRMPSLTWSVLSTGIAAARGLRAGRLTRAELEEALRRIFVNHRHRKHHPQRRVVLPIVDALWLALDIDTEEEARAAGARMLGWPLA